MNGNILKITNMYIQPAEQDIQVLTVEMLKNIKIAEDYRRITFTLEMLLKH